MFSLEQPNQIIFGNNSASKFIFPSNCLVITSKGAVERGWIKYLKLNKFEIFDQVEPNPSFETVQKICSEFQKNSFSTIVGIGGGSSLDVAKYVGFKLNKKKILIPTTFGSGSEVTKHSVLTIDGKKTSLHDKNFFADIAIIDPNFLKNTPSDVLKNSAIDACAQCTEGFDSKIGNSFTKFLCSKAFDILEDSIINENYENLAFGSLLAGLGFGNCSTTLGHALSYVFSNQGYSHGHALAFTTYESHKFNKSQFTNRFYKIREKLDFNKIVLKVDIDEAVETIMLDKKHLDNNPVIVKKEDVKKILSKFIE